MNSVLVIQQLIDEFTTGHTIGLFLFLRSHNFTNYSLESVNLSILIDVSENGFNIFLSETKVTLFLVCTDVKEAIEFVHRSSIFLVDISFDAFVYFV